MSCRTGRTGKECARGDPVLWIGFASCAGALTTVAAVPTILVALITGVLLVRGGVRWPVFMALVAFGLGAARGHGAIARHERARTLVVDAGGWPSRCTLAGTVVRSPVSVGGGLRIEVDASEVRCRDNKRLLLLPARSDTQDDGLSLIHI